MVKVASFPDWESFRRDLQQYVSLDRTRREQILYRGHSNSKWPLSATLDRVQTFSGDPEREQYIQSLLSEFQREATALGMPLEISPTSEAFELLARHHGLPSPLIDWTESPYIACYFAFEGAALGSSARVAIWMFDKAKFNPAEGVIDLIEDQALLRYNKRALRQRSQFMRVLTVQKSVARLLGEALTRIEIPATSRRVALADLDEMAINSTTLFPDLDGAAKTAAMRIAQ